MTKTPYLYVLVFSEIKRFFRRRLNVLLHGGRTYQCPVCFRGWHASAQRAPCLYCGSVTRHKVVVLWLEAHLDALFGSRRLKTLQFAPEFGLESWLRGNDRITLNTADYSAPGVDYHWDITAIPAKDDSYDLIICTHVMEHVPDDAKAFSELARILRPNGLLLIQVPIAREQLETDEDFTVNDPEERKRRFGQFDHVRLYGRDILDRMRAGGLNSEMLTVDSFICAKQMKHHALWNDVLFVCRVV